MSRSDKPMLDAVFFSEEIRNVAEIREAYHLMLGRYPSNKEIRSILERSKDGTLDNLKLVVSISLSAEYMDRLSLKATELHLEFLHNTRTKLIRDILPPAKVILDIGGANGSMIDYGYKHEFDKLIVTDLPPELRIQELQSVKLEEKFESNEKINTIYASMTSLPMIEDSSVDLIWVGQVVEHVHEHELVESLKEFNRILKDDGHLCFDTPNALMTRIHSPEQLIHPEHKKEYSPQEMRSLLSSHFAIEQELGLVPMPQSYKEKVFSYHEMALNNCFSDNLDHCYIMYFECKKK